MVSLKIKSWESTALMTSSNNLETSLIITMMLKEQGAKKVIAKVNQDLHAKFLLSNGADAVIYPENISTPESAI